SGVFRCDGRAPVGDRVVVFEPPSLKPSHGHDATSTTDGARIARNSLRNCRMSKLALAKSRQPALRDDLLLDSRELVDAGGADQARVRGHLLPPSPEAVGGE